MVQTLQQNLTNLDADEYEVMRSLCHLSKNLYNKTLRSATTLLRQRGVPQLLRRLRPVEIQLELRGTAKPSRTTNNETSR